MANNNSGRDKNEKDLVCSFCGKHQDEVERMIIGPGVNICSECIGLCADLLSDKPDHPGSNSSRSSRGSASVGARFDAARSTLIASSRWPLRASARPSVCSAFG